MSRNDAKGELIDLVQTLWAMGYPPKKIAVALSRSRRRIEQLAAELELPPQPEPIPDTWPEMRAQMPYTLAVRIGKYRFATSETNEMALAE